MVHWTDHERKVLNDLWGKINRDEVGPQALARLLIVYPWTQRYFASFGNLSNPAAITGNPEVIRHGKVVLVGVDKALHHLDHVKSEFSTLSALHSDKLHVDPSNFPLLGHTLTVTVAAKLGPSVFTPEAHEVWQKFLNVIVSALSTQYH